MIENQEKICLIHVNIFNHICINSNKEMLRLHDTGDIIYTNDNLILILLCNEEIRLNQFVIRT